MAMAIPFAGAAVGWGLGAAVGYASMGASVGWLIGSWIYNSTLKKKNQIFDPGAQELPRPNQALRGVTLPVLFGTNRVPSQIVWQNNFQTIRSESKSGGGGGKFGGSGTGGKSGSSTKEVSYTYKLDMIFHLGMVPEPYGLLGAWRDTDRLSGETIAAIYSGALQNAFFQANGTATLEYDEATYFPGNHPESSHWSHFSDSVGHPVRWPKTAWVGIKALELGPNPYVPQMSWEIGPGVPEIDCDDEFIRAQGVDGAEPDIIGVSQYNYAYFVTDSDGAKLYGFGRDTGTFTTMTIAEIAANIPAFTVNGNTLPTCDRIRSAKVVCGGQYVVLACTGGVFNSDFFVAYYFVFRCQSDGTLEFIRFKWFVTGYSAWTGGADDIQIGGDDDEDSNIWLMGRYNSSGDTTIWKLPTINQMINDTAAQPEFDHQIFTYHYTPPTDALDYLLNIALNQGYQFLKQDEGFVGFVVPKKTVGLFGAITIEDYFYFHVPKSYMDVTTDPYISTLAATYPNGVVCRFYLGGSQAGVDQPDLGYTTYWKEIDLSGNSVEVVVDQFIDLDGDEVIPFSDAGYEVDGVTADGSNDYKQANYFQKISDSAYLIWFIRNNDIDTEDDLLLNTGKTYGIRAFIYNPFTEVFTQYGQHYCQTYSGADLGNTANNTSAGYPNLMPYYIDGDIYLVGSQQTEESFGNHVFWHKYGPLTISGGQDVTPPYIIRQILVHEFFGQYPGFDLIDETSYLAAHNYCLNNDIVVSTQYRREEPWPDIVELLLSIYGGFLIWSGGKFKFLYTETSDPVRTLDNSHFVIEERGQPPVEVTKGALQDTANRVKVNYLDRAIDYNQNFVEENDEVDQDLHGIRAREFPPQFVMSERLARLICLRSLWSNLYARDTYEFTLGWKDFDLEPGDVVTIVDSWHNELKSGQRARIVYWNEQERGKFKVVAKQEFNTFTTAVTSAAATSYPSSLQTIGGLAPAVDFNAYELPQEFDTAAAIYVGWIPRGQPYGARLYASPDGTTFAHVLTAEPYPIAGRLYSDLPNADAFSEDVEILLFPSSGYNSNSPTYDVNQTLLAVGPSGRAVGAGLLYVGSEMLAYEGVNLVAQNHYRFDRVYRGWGGTAISAHSSGDYFWKQGAGIFRQELSEDKIGTTVYYKVVPYSIVGAEYNVASIEAKSYVIQGRWFRPQNAPGPWFVNSAGESQRGSKLLKVDSTVDITVGWKDSARVSGFGTGGFGNGGYGRFDADPSSKAWRVEVVGSGDTVVRSTVVSTVAYTYPQSQNVSDNGAWRGNIAFKVTPFGTHGDAPRTSVISLELFQ